MRVTTEKILCAAATVGACAVIGLATHFFGGGDDQANAATSAQGSAQASGASSAGGKTVSNIPIRATIATSQPEIDPVAASKLLGQLQVVRSQLELWRVQHEDRLPDLRKYAQWQQLTGRTSVKGELKDGKGTFGPYLTESPRNPLNSQSSVAISGDDVKLGQLILERPAGFIMSLPSGRLFATDASGRRVIADATLERLQQIARETAVREAAARAARQAAARPGADTREARLASLMDQINTVQAQLLLYKMQHRDAMPDLAKFTDWQQLTNRTDAAGKPSENGEYGPYLRTIPRNPLTGDYRVVLTTDGRKTARQLRDAHIGYVLDPRTAQLWAVDEQGKCISIKRVEAAGR